MANYCDKVTFLEDIKAYRERKKTNPDEPIPDYSAKSIMLISEKLANRPNFIGYSYRSDMISDGIYTCLKYFDSFDPNHSAANPFGYFSQICYFAFLQRLAKEKKQSSIKSKIIAQMPFDLFDVQDQDVDEDFRNSYTQFLQEHNTEEPSIKVKKPRKSKKKDLDDEEIKDKGTLEVILSMSIEDEESE